MATRASLSAGCQGGRRAAERMDFWKASLKVRPMAMFSHALMWVVRRASACGNFSKAQRVLTTT